MVLLAQIAPPAVDAPPQGIKSIASGEIVPGGRAGLAPASVFPADGKGNVIQDNTLASMNPFGAWRGATLYRPMLGPETPATHHGTGADADLPPRQTKKRRASAFVGVAPQGESKKGSLRNEVMLIALIVAVHAAVTWDAQSTNHFFHHCPPGYRPAEVDPLMRPFAGKASMYPMANLFFAVPSDLALLRTRHSRKPIRTVAYAAAAAWMGMEIRQSLLNRGNEQIKSGK